MIVSDNRLGQGLSHKDWQSNRPEGSLRWNTWSLDKHQSPLRYAEFGDHSFAGMGLPIGVHHVAEEGVPSGGEIDG